MCTVDALKQGLRDIRANKPAVLLLWLANLILALAVALPLFRWLQRMNNMVAAEETLRGFSLPLLFDLLRYDLSSVFRLVGTLVFWLVVCSLLVNTFLSGGVLATLANPGQRPFLEHFLAGTGRYFGRFFRLLLGAGLGAGIVLLALNTGLGILVARLSRDASEMTPLLLALGQGMVNIVLGTVILLGLHYARIETVVDGRLGMSRALLHSLVFVLRNVLSVFAIIIVFAVLTGGVYLLYEHVREVLPTTSWLLILGLMAIQQIAALARSAFRVGLYGAEIELFRRRRPTVPEKVAIGPSPLFREPQGSILTEQHEAETGAPRP
jgi:hypothetical protein